MPNIGPKGILRHIDDPAKTIVSATEGTTICWATSSDTSDTVIVRAVAAGKGVHYAGALHTTDENLIEFCSNNLYFAAQEGHCEVEMLLQLSVVSSAAINFGFNDDVLDASNSLPMYLSTTTLAANAGSFIGFVLDPIDATNDCLHCAWVDDTNVGQTDSDVRVGGQLIKMPTMTMTAAKWLYMKVELDDRGSGNGARATFLAVDHTGKSEQRTFNTSIDRDVPLCFYFGAQNRAGVASNVYIRCPNWAQTIPNM